MFLLGSMRSCSLVQHVWATLCSSSRRVCRYADHLLKVCFTHSTGKAYSPALPVGTQHYYKNSWHALKTIFKAERWRVLVRGIDAAMLRTAMGSSVRASIVSVIHV